MAPPKRIDCKKINILLIVVFFLILKTCFLRTSSSSSSSPSFIVRNAMKMIIMDVQKKLNGVESLFIQRFFGSGVGHDRCEALVTG